MTASLMSRLVRLEGRQAPPVEVETSFGPAIRLLWLLLAVHAGGLQPHEAIAEGVARALGYATARELRAAMTADRTAFIGWNRQHSEAIDRLLATQGGGLQADGTRNEAAVRALLTSLPEAFHDHHTAADAEATIKAAVEWICI